MEWMHLFLLTIMPWSMRMCLELLILGIVLPCSSLGSDIILSKCTTTGPQKKRLSHRWNHWPMSVNSWTGAGMRSLKFIWGDIKKKKRKRFTFLNIHGFVLRVGFCQKCNPVPFFWWSYTQGFSELWADYRYSIQVKIDCFLHIWELIWSCVRWGESLLGSALIIGTKYEGNETRTF